MYSIFVLYKNQLDYIGKAFQRLRVMYDHPNN